MYEIIDNFLEKEDFDLITSTFFLEVSRGLKQSK